MNAAVEIPHLGSVSTDSGFIPLEACSDTVFRVGINGVISITATGDHKVEFIAFQDRTLAYVNSRMGYPAYYPVHPVELQKPVRAVLMDLDGTSVKSEHFWIWIIQLTTASLMGNPHFELEESDLPFVSGHSVSEHLQYCIRKYCPDQTVEKAREIYFEHTHREMEEIVQGRGRSDAFTPSPGLADFLLSLKSSGIKIALVTSGLYEKAWPEILSAFRAIKLGDPAEFYDAIITAGFPMRKGQPGTLGELSPKPHPWLYAEAGRVGLGIDFAERNSVVGIEDSGAGVCAIRLAGYPTVGISGGNIIESGVKTLCCNYCHSFDEVLAFIS
jgi:beta-phosphoglucomutase